MMIVNRFIEIAEGFADRDIPLGRVFQDAEIVESEHVVEAMYVISSRRLASGRPIQIDEIATAIPDLVVDQSVLDAAIDISMQGLIASGLTQDKAYDSLLESTSSILTKTNLIDDHEISTALRKSIERVHSFQINLPVDFGRPGLDAPNRYELRRILGSGNQGVVYEAVDRDFQEDGMPSLVALKVFHASADPERSRIEGARARRVKHKNVASVIDQGETEEGDSYLAYELIEGPQLDVWKKHLKSPLTPEHACRLVADLARGLQSAHTAGVVHRDIKPSNILVNRDEEPVITDFGIAHSSATDPRLCSHYGTRGSLAFMAPEQFDGTIDGAMPSVDIYALGGILFWLLTNSYPNGDVVSEALIWLEQRNEAGPTRIDLSGIDARLVAIMMRALCVDPSERYQSAEALAIDLQDYLSDRMIPWLDTHPLSKIRLFAKRNPLVVLLNLLVIASVGISVGVWVNGRAGILLERAQAQSAVEIERLNGQIGVEQERVAQIKERVNVIGVMMRAWSNAIESSKDEDRTTTNLLFLHFASTSGILVDDPEYAEKILNRRVEVAEEYLATTDLVNTSPIQRAMWHEMLGNWYADLDNQLSIVHRDEAISLVTDFAPNDNVWKNRILEIGE